MDNLELIELEFNQLIRLYKDKTVEVAAFDVNGNIIIRSCERDACNQCSFILECPKLTNNILNNPNISSQNIEEMRDNGVTRFIKDIHIDHDENKIFHRFEVSVSPVKDKDNNLIGYIMLCEELTKKYLENYIRENTIQSVFKALSLSKIITLRLDLKTLQTVAFMDGECIVLSMEQCLASIYPKDSKRLNTYMNKLISGAIDYGKIVSRFIPPKGVEYRWFESVMRAVYDGKGERQYVLGTHRDVTDEYVQKEKLKKSQKEIRLMNEQLNRVLQMSQIVPFLWYPERGEFYMNMITVKDRYKVFSKGKSTLAYDDVIANIHPDNRQEVTDLLDDIRSGRIDSGCCKTRYDVNKEWDKIFILSIGQNESREDDELSFMGFMQDVSTDEKMKEELIAAKMKAEEIGRIKSAFIANMSHEIRTPLNAIVGFSDLMGETDDPGERKEFFNIVKKNNDLLLQLVNDIIEISRIESGRLERVPKRFNLTEMFRESEGMYKLMIEKPTINVCMEIPEEDVFVILDRRRIGEVMTNFMSNANKYTNEGHVKFGFVCLPNDTVKLYVEDTGCGISEENKHLVFERFEKLGSYVQGAGLGMAICQNYVKTAGGEIGVDSVLGKGSTFWITLPTGD